MDRMKLAKKTLIYSLSVLGLGCLFTNPLSAQRLASPESARVVFELLPVLSSNAPKSQTVKYLRKGDLVTVQMTIGGEAEWCVIAEQGNAESGLCCL